MNAVDMLNTISQTLDQINEQIAAAEREARRLGVPVATLRLSDGSWVLTPLLAARAQCLNTIALMVTAP